MNYETIADVYTANGQIREHLTELLQGLSEDEINALPEGETWSIKQIVEHIAMVDEGTAKICAKLVGGAKEAGKTAEGKVDLSPEFGEKSVIIAGMKVEAPERVQPTGEMSIEDSLERMRQAREVFDSLRDDLESYDLSEHTFPHPFFGQITAAEWLVLAGGHQNRHAKQIERLIERVRQ